MKLLLFLLTTSWFFTNVAHAAGYNSYYCEKGFRTVQIGDAMETVRAACGDPTSNDTREKQISTSINVLRWVYTLGLFSIKGTAYTLPTIAITFHDQKVMGVERAGIPIANAVNAACALNGTVNIGDTVQQVLAMCGQPNYTSNAQQTVNSTKIITEWIYNFGPYKPQIILDFENGKLAQITSGQLGK